MKKKGEERKKKGEELPRKGKELQMMLVDYVDR
jgi:hypothetical protein